jgi:hypothetical protein
MSIKFSILLKDLNLFTELIYIYNIISVLVSILINEI